MPSGAQLKVRSSFKASCDCFNVQPQTDPVPPPSSGPRGRDWWYSQAGPSGLWYYNYFMQQSIPHYLLGAPPDWCIYNIILASGQGYLNGGGYACTENPEQCRNKTYNEWKYWYMGKTPGTWWLGYDTYSKYDGRYWAYWLRGCWRMMAFTTPAQIKPGYACLLVECDPSIDPIFGPCTYVLYRTGFTKYPDILDPCTSGALLSMSFSNSRATYKGGSYLPFYFSSSFLQPNKTYYCLIRLYRIEKENPIPPVIYYPGSVDKGYYNKYKSPTLNYLLLYA